MKYTFNRDGKEEAVSPEKWVWGVLYKDDTDLHQFGEDGKFHQIKEIKWEDVNLFTMYKLDDPKKRIDLVASPEIQIFHFYRNIKPFYTDKFVKVYVFGYKVRGTKQAVYNFILSDDRIIVADRNNIDLSKFELQRSENKPIEK